LVVKSSRNVEFAVLKEGVDFFIVELIIFIFVHIALTNFSVFHNEISLFSLSNVWWELVREHFGEL